MYSVAVCIIVIIHRIVYYAYYWVSSCIYNNNLATQSVGHNISPFAICLLDVTRLHIIIAESLPQKSHIDFFIY